MPEATTYLAGHVKRDPTSGAVAVRTVFPEDDPILSGQAWLLATTARGAHFARTSDVESWDDLYTPEPPAGP